MSKRRQFRPDVSVDEVVRLYVEEGLSTHKLAAHFQCTVKTINRRLAEAKVTLKHKAESRNRRKIERLLSSSGIGTNQAGIPRKIESFDPTELLPALDIETLATRISVKLSAETVSQMKELYLNGLSKRKISRQFNVATETVSAVLLIAGLIDHRNRKIDPVFSNLVKGVWVKVAGSERTHYSELYKRAKYYGIKIKVRKNDKNTVWITKVETDAA